MPPKEFTSRPAAGRQPYPRRRIAIDGVSPGRPLSRPQSMARSAAAGPVMPPRPAPIEPIAPEPMTNPAVLERERFAPPKPKKQMANRRRLTQLVTAALVTIGVAAALTLFLQWRASNNNVDTMFKAALLNSLSVKQVEATTTSGVAKNQVSYDFSTPSNAVVSSQSTIQLSGASFGVAGYGTAKNTYISYTTLPTNVTPSVANVVKNAWVGIRTSGVLPAGVPAQLQQLSDPRFLAYKPFIIGNYSATTQKQIISYILSHTAYDYIGKKTTHQTIGDAKTIVYDVQPGVAALKVANQIAAASQGLLPADIQAAVDSLDALKGASMKIYIASSDHRLVRTEISKNGTKITTDYANYGKASVSAEPPTKLQWPTFATYQFQMAAQVASHLSAAQLDVARKQQLATAHRALAQYYKQVGAYPTLANINDPAWLANNLIGLDPDVFRDPLAASLTVLSAPKAGNLSYQSTPENGSGICDDSPANLCAHFKLTAVLSNNQQFSIQDP